MVIAHVPEAPGAYSDTWCDTFIREIVEKERNKKTLPVKCSIKTIIDSKIDHTFKKIPRF